MMVTMVMPMIDGVDIEKMIMMRMIIVIIKCFHQRLEVGWGLLVELVIRPRPLARAPKV